MLNKMNYEDILDISYKNVFINIIFIFLICIFIIYATNNSVYDKLVIYGYYQNEYILINIQLEDTKNLKNSDYLIIDDKKYSFEVIEYGNINVINNGNYQEVKILVEESFFENEVIEIKFFYNKEKIINKIYEKIF